MVSQQTTNRILPVAAAVSIPVIIVGARLILGDGIPLQALAVMASAWALALVWTAMHMAQKAREAELQPAAETGVEAVRVDVVAEAMALLESMRAPQEPRQIEVMSEVGVCPRGLKVEPTFSVDSDGRLSVPICRVAVEALEPLVTVAPGTEDFQPQVSCICPQEGVHLTFAVGSNGAAAAG